MSTISSYPPDFQGLECRFFTFAGWVTGVLRLPMGALLVDFLNRGDPLFQLAGVTLPGRSARHPFFVLERTAVIAVVPIDQTIPILRATTSQRRSSRHATSWLLPGGGAIEGVLDMLEGVHVGEHLMHRTNFVPLYDCTLFLPDSAGVITIEPGVAAMGLQANRVVGVTEIP